MSITAQLENIKKLEAVNFTHEQAEILAEIQETTAKAHDESLKEYMEHKFEYMKHKFDHIESKFIAEISKANSDLLIKIFGIIVGSISIAVAIIKLFP